MAADPIDRLLQPTAAEKAALVGTGTPAGTNPYVVSDDARLNTTPDLANRLVSGGGVAWITGYTFHVAASTVSFNGVLVNTPPTDVILNASDPADDRIDLIVANSNGTISFVTGTATTPPASPDYDPLTQFQLAFVTVDAGSAQPSDISLTTIYEDNTEWTTATSGATIDANSVNNPYSGTKDVEATLAVNNNYVTFTNASDIALDGYSSLLLWLWPKAAFAGRAIRFNWERNSGARLGNYFTLTDGVLGFNSSSASYQLIAIPISMFGISAGTTTVRRLRAQVISSAGSMGWYMDLVQLQVSPIIPTLSVPEATESSPGIVQLAATGDASAALVVQGSDTRLKLGASLVLINGYTPTGTGADGAEVTVPYSPADGTTSVTWNVRRITFRVSVAGGAPAVRVEKSTAAGAFSAATVGDVTLGGGAYEGSNTTALGTVASGNKLRFNVITLATAQYWTVEVELGES